MYPRKSQSKYSFHNSGWIVQLLVWKKRIPWCFISFKRELSLNRKACLLWGTPKKVVVLYFWSSFQASKNKGSLNKKTHTHQKTNEFCLATQNTSVTGKPSGPCPRSQPGTASCPPRHSPGRHAPGPGSCSWASSNPPTSAAACCSRGTRPPRSPQPHGEKTKRVYNIHIILYYFIYAVDLYIYIYIYIYIYVYTGSSSREVRTRVPTFFCSLF